jgi:LmbE family N-acetylglucosaminyl deacetylase
MNKLTILAAYAHPDDGEFFLAGSLARWAAEGHDVVAVCATSGDLGTADPNVDRAALAATREAELARAMEVIGGRPPILLRLPDGGVREHSATLRERLIHTIRAVRPHRVITFDPWKKYEVHPDHIEVGRMASEAAVFACFPLLHPEHQAEGLAPHKPDEVWYVMPTEERPNRVVDIRSSFDKKVASLLCHSSQIELLAGWFVPGADPRNLTEKERAALNEGARSFLEMMARGTAQLAPKVELAEAFLVQKCGPGHFDNYQSMFQRIVSGAPEPPEVE